MESRRALDEKFRLAIPADIRETVGSSFVLTVNIGGDKCLDLYSMEQWAGLIEKIRGLKRSDPRSRMFERYFVGARLEGSFDKQGRILVPQNLRSHANLTREVDVIPLINSVELWDAGMKEEALSGLDLNEIVSGLDI